MSKSSKVCIITETPTGATNITRSFDLNDEYKLVLQATFHKNQRYIEQPLQGSSTFRRACSQNTSFIEAVCDVGLVVCPETDLFMESEAEHLVLTKFDPFTALLNSNDADDFLSLYFDTDNGVEVEGFECTAAEDASFGVPLPGVVR